ncbi:hypothetical protein FB192DRAFT_1348165 [Mucor lusitanicus]|uniref:Uncharacterized protein n=1 Tax=Mucor circinelloides f. lusitanicus TaxID=29924 RepID=A0A8H4B6J1_MUCCL|nr:hypothetical protein FB192DRAFT_1348165 [Mucor lusitanicus]
MQRYATPANFWLFYYERLNADLKAINTNKNIEKTFFTRFLNNVHAKELFEKVSKPIDMPSDICDELEQLLVSTESSKSKVPTNKTMQAEYEESQDAFELSSYLAKETLEQPDNSDIFVGLEILPPPIHFACLVEFYNATYNDDAEVLTRYVGGQQGGISSSDGYVIPVSNLIQKFKSVKLFTCIYKSMEGTSSKVKRGSFVLARCRNDRTPGSEASSLRPGQIVYFFRSSVSVLDPETGEMFDDQVHTFAFCHEHYSSKSYIVVQE